MKLVAGSSNLSFAQNLGQALGLELTVADLTQFGNGEKRVWIKEPIKGENVILVQSFQSDTDIMEFLLLADALERMGARHINAVIPWLAYSRQDKVFREGEPIAAKVIANLVSNAYIKRAFLLDLHNSSITGFFSIPTQHISALDLFVEYVKQTFDLKEFVVASPDFGGLKRARVFADKLRLPLVNIDKHRDLHTGKAQAMGISGDVAGKSVLLFDDMIDSGGTVVTTAEILKENGANQVHFLATHGPLVASAFAKLENARVDSVIVTDSIFPQGKSSKVNVISVAPLFAEAIKAWWKSSN
jgi:ribose-phosphate pyrophosphokinase